MFDLIVLVLLGFFVCMIPGFMVAQIMTAWDEHTERMQQSKKDLGE